MQYTVTRGESISPAKLVAAGQKFGTFNRTRSKYVALTRESVATKWPGVTVEPIGDAKNPEFSGAIIEAWTDASGDEGGTQVDMPIFGHLSKPPLGDTEAEGLGESIPMYIRHMYLTLFRKPLSMMTKLNAQKIPQALLRFVNNKNSLLYDYWERHWDGNIQHTLLTGYDVLLTNYREITGQESAQTPFSPPNFAVAGSGRVSYTEVGSGRPATAAYETTLKLKLASLINDPTKGLTTDRALWAQQDALDCGIPQWSTPWGQFTVWVIDSWQAYQFKRDAEYREDLRFAAERGKGNPIFSDNSFVWSGNLFFVTQGGFGVQHSGDSIVAATNSTLGMPAYGPTNYWISDDGTAAGLDRNSIKIANILGPGALHKLLGRNRFEFKRQTGDFERRDEYVLEAYCNLVRGDIFDNRNEDGSGANSFKTNQSHYALATWSPVVANA
jgi:hypothetical protein